MDINKLSEYQVRQLFQCSDTNCQCHKNSNVHCPCHDDENPSMTVNKPNGKILVDCKAGCEQGNLFKEVCRIVNEKLGDNSNSSNSNHEKKKAVDVKGIYNKCIPGMNRVIKKYFSTRNIEINDNTIETIGLRLSY